MATTCLTCGKRSYSDYCMQHKPKKPIKSRSVKPKAVKAKTTKPKAKKRSWYVNKLDKLYSEYIRLSKSDDNGIATCVTCGNKAHWKEMQNGHFISRGKYPTRWDVYNCHIQDYRCNVALNGNYIEYTMFMIDNYGRDFVEELKHKSINGEKKTTSHIQQLIDHYEKVVRQLKEEKS